MPATYDDGTRLRCKSMYCLQRKDLDGIEEITEPSISTLRRWRAKGRWDEERVHRTLSGPMLAQKFMQQIDQILQGAIEEGRMLTQGETDQIAKLQKVASKHNGRARFTSHALEAVDQLNTWLASNYPDLREDMATPLLEFSRWLGRKNNRSA
jgi:hypothetical protein